MKEAWTRECGRCRYGFKGSIRDCPNGGASHTIGFNHMDMSQPPSSDPFLPQIPLEITEQVSHHRPLLSILSSRNQEPNSPRTWSNYCLCNPDAFCFDIRKRSISIFTSCSFAASARIFSTAEVYCPYGGDSLPTSPLSP